EGGKRSRNDKGLTVEDGARSIGCSLFRGNDLLFQKTFHLFSIFPVVEKVFDSLGHRGADLFDVTQFFLRGRHEPLERTEVGGEKFRGPLAHQSDSQGINKSSKGGFPAGINRRN